MTYLLGVTYKDIHIKFCNNEESPDNHIFFLYNKLW
jgi:hypothetical protein